MVRILLLLLEIVYLILAFKSESVIYFCIAVFIFTWWAYETKKEINRKDAELQKETIEMLEKIPHTRYTVSTDYLRALLIDEHTNTLYIAEREEIDSDFEEKEFRFHEIYEAAIEEDGELISLISRGGVDGWSLLHGRTDLLVNVEDLEKESEESDEEVTDDVVNKLSIKIAVDDLSNPIVEFAFIDDEQGLSKESEIYLDILKECNRWHQKISVIIKRHDRENVAVNSWVQKRGGIIIRPFSTTSF